jgi:2-polyprenyl-3-methyl-5-hydroxy-6-metoxy-1,4-benzoquinol methylase
VTTMVSERQRALEHFISTIDRQRVVAEITAASGAEPAAIRRRLDTYLNECRVGLDLVEPYLHGARRLLEVGAGIGALSAFLASEGFDIVAIEPAGPGFDVVAMMRRSIDAQLDGVVREVLDAGVDEIPDDLGTFDLVFSVHVLEHVPDVDTAIAAMQRQLAPNGRSVHVCPNYAFPFDPHFGIPLIPGLPAATTALLPTSIRSSGMWSSLNFVTAGQVRRSARRLGLTVDFRRGVLGEMVDRLDSDPVFRGRHEKLVSITDLLFHRLRLRAALDRWPPGLASPMVFQLRPRPTS